MKKEGAAPRPILNTINNDIRMMKIGRNIEGIHTINGNKCSMSSWLQPACSGLQAPHLLR